MSYIKPIISEDLLNAFGWMLVHSFWQITLIALLLWIILSVNRNMGPAKRYQSAFCGMLLVLLSGILTFSYYYFGVDGFTEDLGNSPKSTLGDLLNKENSVGALPTQTTYFFNSQFPLMVTFWLVGFGVFMFRLIFGLVYIQYLKRVGQKTLSLQWHDLVNALSKQLKVQKEVDIAESSLITVPLVIGHFQPLILFPVGVINQLSVAEVEAIIAHEIAHIVRKDYLQNIVLSLIEAIYFYHPAVWWIAWLLRVEREHCCDDLAIQHCVAPIPYAKALYHIESMNQRTPIFSMPFGNKQPLLLHRIQRILNHPQKKSDMMEKLMVTILLIFGIFILSASSFISESEGIKNVEPSLSPLEKELVTKNKKNLVVEEIPLIDLKKHSTKSLKNGQEKREVITKEASKSFPLTKEIIKPLLPVEPRDTLPKREVPTFTFSKDGQSIKIQTKANKITHLTVNGKQIPKAVYPKYEAQLAKLMNVPPPPPPPPPLSAERANAAPPEKISEELYSQLETLQEKQQLALEKYLGKGQSQLKLLEEWQNMFLDQVKKANYNHELLGQWVEYQEAYLSDLEKQQSYIIDDLIALSRAQ